MTQVDLKHMSSDAKLIYRIRHDRGNPQGKEGCSVSGTADRYDGDDLDDRAPASGIDQGPNRPHPDEPGDTYGGRGTDDDQPALTNEDRGEGREHQMAEPDMTKKPYGSLPHEGWLHGQQPATDPFGGCKAQLAALEQQLGVLKAAALAHGATATGISHTTYSGPPRSPIASAHTFSRGHFDQQPANLAGQPAGSMHQGLAPTQHGGMMNVETVDLRGAAGHYGGQQSVVPSPMQRAILQSHVLPSPGGASYTAPGIGLTRSAPGETR
jgi:hypothetical protein